MRISTSQIFSQSLNYMSSALNDVAELNMMTSSQKRINRPSDDPSGMGKVMELTAYNQSLSGYADNCDVTNEYLGLADEVLLQASEYITAALELTEQGSTETYTAVQLAAMAPEMQGYLDSLLTVANTKSGNDYLFSGDDLGDSPYEMGLGVTLPNSTLDATAFASLTGEAETPIYVRFDDSGTIGTNELDYSYSTDFGETWTSGTLSNAGTTIDVGTAQVEFVSGTTVTEANDDGEGTLFYVRQAAVYTGSSNAMSVSISESTSVDMTTVGSDLFGGVDESTGQAYEQPNLFEIISDCIVYLQAGDSEGVASCLEALDEANEVLETGAANIGARENKTTYTSEALSSIISLTTNRISSEEDADAAQLVVELEQANYVYEAVLSSSSDIMKMSLLNYI